MPDLQRLLKLLVHSPIEFVLIGGFAAVLHGCNQTTRDIDICILRSPEQINLLQALLKPLHPEQRIATTGQDLHWNTDLGPLDIVAHVKGVGDYYDVLRNSEEIEIYGAPCRLISLGDLIKSKKALGRHRDLVTAMELEVIRAERNKELPV